MGLSRRKRLRARRRWTGSAMQPARAAIPPLFYWTWRCLAWMVAPFSPVYASIGRLLIPCPLSSSLLPARINRMPAVWASIRSSLSLFTCATCSTRYAASSESPQGWAILGNKTDRRRDGINLSLLPSYGIDIDARTDATAGTIVELDAQLTRSHIRRHHAGQMRPDARLQGHKRVGSPMILLIYDEQLCCQAHRVAGHVYISADRLTGLWRRW